MMRHYVMAGVVLVVLVLLPTPGTWALRGDSALRWQATAAPHPSSTGPDFNGDGFADLSIGVPGERVGGYPEAGAVNVIYGSPGGLSAAGNQLWTQDSGGVEDSAELRDHFGAALAPGDFNGDGFTDLAIGVPEEDVGTIGDAGAVNVLYGSTGGLSAAGSQLWTQDSPDVVGKARAHDGLGRALATGDFNRDGFTDLAVGVWRDDVGAAESAGAVNVLYGSAGGLTAAGNQLWTQDSSTVGDVAEFADWFGWAVASGDFNGDGFADLAVGVAGEDLPSVPDAGAVNVLYGSAAGLSAEGNTFWTQDTAGVKDVAEIADFFGSALAAGDFNGDGRVDLAIGAAYEDVGDVRDAGAVNVLYGSTDGLVGTSSQFWTQDSPGVEDAAEPYDLLGAALTAADFTGDGYADLAIGAPLESLGAFFDAGAVNVLYGAATGLSAVGDQFWTQDSPGVLDAVEGYDAFAGALAGGDYSGDGYWDLAVGVPSEDVQRDATLIRDGGAVNVLYGTAGGLSAAGNQFWTQDSPGVVGGARRGDLFSSALASP